METSVEEHGYETVAVGGRLAAALLSVGRLFDYLGIREPNTKSFLDHMWLWLTVTATTFGQWESWTNPVLEVALGGRFQSVPAVIPDGNPFTPDDFRAVCGDVAELVYGNLFGKVDHAMTLSLLRRLRDRLARFGIDLPPL